MNLLDALSRATATASSFEGFFSRAAAILGPVFAFDRLSISVYRKEAHRLETFALRTAIADTHIPEGTIIELNPLLQELAASRQGILLPDLEMADHPLAKAALADGLRSSMVAPLFHTGQFRGTLAMSRRKHAPYTEHDLQRLQQVADLVAPTVESARLYRELQMLDNVRESVIATNLDGVVTYWGKGAERLYGYRAVELVGKPITDFIVPPEDAAAEEARMAEVRASGYWEGEYLQRRKDGKVFWSETFISLVRDDKGEPVGLVGIDHDISERKALQAATATVSSTLELERVLDLILSEIGRVLPNDNATIFLLNEDVATIAAAHPNEEEAVGLQFPVEDDPFIQQMSKSGKPVLLDDARNHPQYKGWAGTQNVRGWLAVPLISPDRIIGYLTLDSYEPAAYSRSDADLALSFAQNAAIAVVNARLHDDLLGHLADLELAQKRLLQSEKLAAIGELVAGVAHELNNPLAAILLFTQLLQRREKNAETLDKLDQIEEQALRARDIIESLLDFARWRPPQYEAVDVNEVLKSSLALLSYRLKSHNISLSLDLDPDLPPVQADPGQLQQVFVNIINNAFQALQEGDEGGHLSVRSEQDTSRFLPFREQGTPEVVCVRIHNDGPSISPEDLPRIFDPFFTTKEPGKGTGLGLSVSYGIIRQHDGNIWVESPPHAGVAFYIELPLLARPEEADEAGIEESAGDAERGGRALVVDDEPILRHALREALQTVGIAVDEAADGNDALVKVAQNSYALILCDIRMPGLGGIAFFHRVNERYPEMASRILFVTGDTVNEETRAFLEATGLPCLAKPFDVETLLQKVEEVWEAG